MKNRIRLRPARRLILVAPGLALLCTLGCAFGPALNTSETGMNLYFVRHAETQANVTGEKTPENNRIITELGRAQIRELTPKLKALNPDVVLVSPTYRTMETVLPLLEAKNSVAEIWPELEEWRMEADPMTMLAVPRREAEEIRIEPHFGLYFKFRDADSDKRYFARDYAGGLEQTQKTAALIRKRFAGTGRSVLVVGHSNAGARLLEVLLGLEPTVRFKLQKARITHLRQNAAGHFEMDTLNEIPYHEGGE